MGGSEKETGSTALIVIKKKRDGDRGEDERELSRPASTLRGAEGRRSKEEENST